METLFQIAILVMSVVIHEVSHGYAAKLLGDKTAEYQGRLTLNPISHIDLLGSIIVPVVLYLTHAGFMVGWAKPVPVNPYNLRHGKWGEVIVSVAGPLSNVFVALFFGLILRFVMPSGFLSGATASFVATIVFINLALALFNLMPVPPLDGSKILAGILPSRARETFLRIEQNPTLTMVLAFIFIFYIWNYLTPLIPFMFSLITGAGL